MPTSRSEIAATELDGIIYVAGGLLTFGPTTAFEAYDPTTNTWRSLAPLPVGLHHIAMAAARGRVFVTGGYGNIFFRPNRRSAWAYDPKENRWIPIANMPAPRTAHAMASIDGKLHVIGGVGLNSASLWVYDPRVDRWDTTRKPMLTSREQLAAVGVNGKLYVIGGRWKGRGNLGKVEVYDAETDRWETRRDMPTPRSSLTAALVDGRIHVTGGEIPFPGHIFGEHEVYDPAPDTWSALSNLPTPRHGLASAAISGQWFVVGWATRPGVLTLFTRSDVVEIFAPSGTSLNRRLANHAVDGNY